MFSIFRIEKKGFGPFYWSKRDFPEDWFPFKKDINCYVDYPHPSDSKDEEFYSFVMDKIGWAHGRHDRNYFYGCRTLKDLLNYFSEDLKTIRTHGYEVWEYTVSECKYDKNNGAAVFHKDKVIERKRYDSD